MTTQARVVATDAFESFRASLVAFQAKAHRCVEDASDEVRRTRGWLQHDQRLYWDGEIRRRAKLLDQAQQELRSVQFTGARDSSVMMRRAAVERTQQSLAEAEAKLKRVKDWGQKYDNNADPILKRLEGLRQYLDTDIPKATAYLRNAQMTLEEYADAPPSISSPPGTTASDGGRK